MKTEEEMRADFEALEHEKIDKVCELLKGHEGSIKSYLADFVANLCDVSLERMLSETSIAYLSQARAFFWYSLRYMHNETYTELSIHTQEISGVFFTPNGIGQSVNKIASLIDKEPVWQKRWTVIRRLIKLYHESTGASRGSGESIKLVVRKPHDVNVNIELKNE